MPVHEYQCEKCSNFFEVQRKISDSKEKVKCPSCGETKCRRVYSGFSTGTAPSRDSCVPQPHG